MRLLHSFSPSGLLPRGVQYEVCVMAAALKKRRVNREAAIVGDFYAHSVALLATVRQTMAGQAATD